ncbi:MAG: CHAT domain-containing protein, partial [Chitinophagales bacterium]
LYQKLLKPILPQLKKTTTDLIIVPDGMLGYLPFEALISELPKDTSTHNYSIHNLAYLVEDFQINYTYSANLSLKQESIIDLLKIPFEKEKTLLAYAPSFYGKSDDLLVRSCTDTLAELRCAKTEVQDLRNKWNAKAFLGEKATKKHFLEQAVKSDILHLATHACMDDHNPNFNRIYFAEQEYLTSLELYTLQLRPQLTVLSACNTGSGQLVKGEGVMSLARGFMVAGCPSLITTLWGVNDFTTQNLMTSFYEHLYNGEQKDEALRNAKLDYLQDSETTSSHSHPFYWAAFVQLGDNRAMFKKETPLQSIWFYGLGMVLLGSFVFLFNKKK